MHTSALALGATQTCNVPGQAGGGWAVLGGGGCAGPQPLELGSNQHSNFCQYLGRPAATQMDVQVEEGLACLD